jgi:molybdopterin-guanine dinucleotide biosynthesis protein A
MIKGICGIVLAGGKSRRMGGVDKAGLMVGDMSMVEVVSARLRLQANPVLINSNVPTEVIARLGLEVRPDSLRGWLGPLAGILTGLEWAEEKGCPWLMTIPVDCPFFPENIVERLYTAVTEQDVKAAVAQSNGRVHPVFGLWSVALRAELHQAVTIGQLRKVMAWVDTVPHCVVSWPCEPDDPFINLNTLQDMGLVNAKHLP